MSKFESDILDALVEQEAKVETNLEDYICPDCGKSLPGSSESMACWTETIRKFSPSFKPSNSGSFWLKFGELGLKFGELLAPGEMVLHQPVQGRTSLRIDLT